MTGEPIIFGACAGIAATVTMDVLASAFRRVGLTEGVKGQWVGRWYLGIVRGQFTHANIADAPALPGEQRAAFIGHYAIGITLAVLYFVGADWMGVSADGFFAAFGYGFATNVFPWFLLFPAFGFGPLGVKGPSELRLLTSSTLNHLAYGFGLWWAATVLPLG